MKNASRIILLVVALLFALFLAMIQPDGPPGVAIKTTVLVVLLLLSISVAADLFERFIQRNKNDR